MALVPKEILKVRKELAKLQKEFAQGCVDLFIKMETQRKLVVKRKMSKKQASRQQYRKKGKYSKVNPCYACGKSAGDDYFSHGLTDTGDWEDIALVLCFKCAKATIDMTKPEQFEEYKKQFVGK